MAGRIMYRIQLSLSWKTDLGNSNFVTVVVKYLEFCVDTSNYKFRVVVKLIYLLRKTKVILTWILESYEQIYVNKLRN